LILDAESALNRLESQLADLLKTFWWGLKEDVDLEVCWGRDFLL
jgi:hypothetical protein